MLVVTFAAACGAADPRPADPAVTVLPVPAFASDTSAVAVEITADSPAGVLLLPPAEPLCSTSSDCAGFGKCSSGKCGACSSSSDCNGHGKCSSGRCGACSSSSDCRGGTCSRGRCSNYTE